MTKKLQQELDEIEKMAIDVSGLISVTKDACEVNDYTSEYSALECALQIQNSLVEKIVNLGISRYS